MSGVSDDRVKYKVAGKAERQAIARAQATPTLSLADWKTLNNVFAVTTTYSKLHDWVRHADLTSGVPARSLRRSLRKLDDTGIIIYRAGSGSGHLSLVGVPPPGQKAASYLATLDGSDLATFEGAEGGHGSDIKVATHARASKPRSEKKNLNRSTKEQPLEPEPSRSTLETNVGGGPGEPEKTLRQRAPAETKKWLARTGEFNAEREQRDDDPAEQPWHAAARLFESASDVHRRHETGET